MTIKVQVVLEARARCEFEVEMTREQYDEYCERIDNARGYKEAEVADDLLALAGVDLARDLDVDDLRVGDFVEIGATP